MFKGSTLRRGKFRPKDFYEQGRKTCNLLHIRVGSASLSMGIWDVQTLLNQYVHTENEDNQLNGIQHTQMDNQVSALHYFLKDCKSLFFDVSLSQVLNQKFLDSLKVQVSTEIVKDVLDVI